MESARWLATAGKPERAVDELKKVAKINRRKEEGDKLNTEVRDPPGPRGAGREWKGKGLKGKAPDPAK